MATFADAEAHTHMDASKWTTRYIDTGQASTTFFQCVDDNGDLHIIEGIWRLIKAFMIMSDEHRDLCRRVSASHPYEPVVVRDGVIVPFLYFTNIFNRHAGTELDLAGGNQITDITALGNALNTNSTLTELYLSVNQITDITALGNALNTNSTLTTLWLDNNQISPEDNNILIKAWKHKVGSGGLVLE